MSNKTLKNTSTISLRQNAPVGVIEITLSEEEVNILRLISAEDDEALSLWRQLWQNTNDYEEFSFSIKELMPSAVKKLQSCTSTNSWQNIAVGNADFLAGLPRYTWTKNQYIINQYKIIAAALQRENIDFIGIKGVAEILASSSLSLMRTSRDIDILIRPEDWEKCKKIFAELGWHLVNTAHRFGFLNNPVHAHADSLFRNKERIIELDVHFTVTNASKSAAKKYTKKLWERKVKAAADSSLFIPSLEDRLIIAATNAYNLVDWQQGLICKYLYDALFITSTMNETQIKNACADGENYLHKGKSMHQLIEVLQKIKEPQHGNTEQKRKYWLRLSVNNSFINKLISLRFATNITKLLFSGVHTFHALFFVVARTLKLLFLKIPKKIGKIFTKNSTNASGKKARSKEQKQLTWYFMFSS